MIALFRIFTTAGERVPVRRGDGELARRLLDPVLYGANGSPERTAARHLIGDGGGLRVKPVG